MFRLRSAAISAIYERHHNVEHVKPLTVKPEETK
jgi:hypothetical protein